MSCEHNKVQVVNEELHIKYPKCLICQPLDRHETFVPEVKLDFRNIIGYDEIKKIMQQIVDNNGISNVNLLLAGDPSTAKSVFLQTIHKNLKAYGYKSHYINAETLTSAGVIDYIFSNDIEFLELDEIDKVDKVHQKTFLNLLENGTMQETKFKKTRKKVMENFICFASANYLTKILEPLLTRFMVLFLRAFTQQEFYIIGMVKLEYQYYIEHELAYYIVQQIWDIFKNYRHEQPVIRDVIRVGKLAGNNKAKVDEVLVGLKKYSVKYEELI